MVETFCELYIISSEQRKAINGNDLKIPKQVYMRDHDEKD